MVGTHKTYWEDILNEERGFSVEGGHTYEILKCCGCDNVHLRHRSWCSEETDEQGRPFVNEKQYPPKITRHEPRWYGEFYWMVAPEVSPVKGLLEEVYRSLGAEAWRLAAMGIRALLETVMIQKVNDNGAFAGNLKALQAEGYISQRQT